MGQVIDLKIIHVNRQKEKISLSLKRTQGSPWQTLAERVPVGSAVKVTISNLVSFGAFAKLSDGIEGLIHISDFSWTKRIRHAEDVLKVGQEIEVKVLEINDEKEKISFGIKQLKQNPFEIYSKGARVSGSVIQIGDAGIAIEIEPEIEGFIPASEISAQKVEKSANILSIGDKVEAKVIHVDAKDKKINLSIKQLDQDLQRAAVKKYSGEIPLPNLGELLDS